MDFHFTAEQLKVQLRVQKFAQKKIAKAIPQMERLQFPKDVIKKMGTLGFMGIPVPKRYGGSDLDYTSYIITIHEISKVSATVGVILSVHTSLVTMPILQYGTEEQKEKFLPDLASGTSLGAFALTEPQAGSDVSNLQLRAEKLGNTYVLNGSKVFITNGQEADLFIVFARTKRNMGTKGISAFIIERDTPGFHIGRPEKKMGLHGASTVSLTLENCKVHESQLLGKLHEGFQLAMRNLNSGRIGIAAQGLGIAEAAFNRAVRYAQERIQFGKPIAEHQAISFKLADMKTEIEAAKLLVYRAATKLTEQQLSIEEASMAKLFATTVARKTAIEAVQIYGSYGCTEENPVERYFRDAKITEIYEGTNEIQKIVISNQLLKQNI